jgi:hypothetical protein
MDRSDDFDFGVWRDGAAGAAKSFRRENLVGLHQGAG